MGADLVSAITVTSYDNVSRAANAVAFLPVSPDLVVGSALEESLVRAEAEPAAKDQAIMRLQKPVQKPYSSVSHIGPITPALLRLHPCWDPLRADLRFQKLCQEQ